PDNWLIDVSLDGSSNELAGILRVNDEIAMGLLRRAYLAWTEQRISNEKLVDVCRALWEKFGYESQWFTDLIGIDAELDLVKQGRFPREDFAGYFKKTIEPIIGD